MMILESYSLEIVNSECNPGATTVQCFARLDQDVSDALPYLNAVLGGFSYMKDPPSVTFKAQGKLIIVHSRKIAVNALKDEDQARKIVEWLKGEINRAWDHRDEIEPRYEGMPRPQLIEILKCLPKTNCGECGEPTCMVFASRVVEGARGAGDCLSLEGAQKEKLETFLKPFHLAMDSF